MKFVNVLAAAGAAALLLCVPARAQTTAIDAGTVPVSDGEQAARSCYQQAKGHWNDVMASAPTNASSVNGTYLAFARCAKVAITTGKQLPNGERLPWFADYFASTIGATYAQLQLSGITPVPSRCSHIILARDLAQQALETSGTFTPPDVQFQSSWQDLTKRLGDQARMCGAKVTSQR